MPTFNRAEKIGLAIKSILNQSYKDWELIIVDNGSIDNTREVVESFIKEDNRIKYFNVKKSQNPGISEYLNYGIEIAVGEYIARLDDDDEWWDEDKLKKQVSFLNENHEYVLVGGGAIVIDEKKKEIYRFFKRESDAEIRKKALYANPFVHSNVLFRKKAVQKTGSYKNISFGEDWELWLRLGKVGKFYNFKDYFSLYLNSGQKMSIDSQKFVGKTILGLIKKHRKDYPNYRKALILNYLQYLYSYTPSFIKSKTQNFLFYVKRNYF